MSKTKKSVLRVKIELPRKGGSYVADASTGKLERKAHTKPVEPGAPAAETPEKKEG